MRKREKIAQSLSLGGTAGFQVQAKAKALSHGMALHVKPRSRISTSTTGAVGPGYQRLGSFVREGIDPDGRGGQGRFSLRIVIWQIV